MHYKLKVQSINFTTTSRWIEPLQMLCPLQHGYLQQVEKPPQCSLRTMTVYIRKHPFVEYRGALNGCLHQGRYRLLTNVAGLNCETEEKGVKLPAVRWCPDSVTLNKSAGLVFCCAGLLRRITDLPTAATAMHCTHPRNQHASKIKRCFHFLSIKENGFSGQMPEHLHVVTSEWNQAPITSISPLAPLYLRIQWLLLCSVLFSTKYSACKYSRNLIRWSLHE